MHLSGDAMKTAPQLKVAIIGCGKIADAHVEEIRKLDGMATVVGVCDREPLMAEQLADRHAIPAHFASVEQLLERTRPDVVHVTTPPQSHAFLARMALEAGCHLYIEKPLAMDLAEARALVQMVGAAGKKMTIGWEFLFDPPALRLRQLVADGVLGAPVHLESCFGYNLASPFGAALLSDASHWVHQLPGKLFHNTIDHLLNKLLEFIDDDEPAVTAFGARLEETRYGDGRDQLLDELRVVVRGRRATATGLFSAHARPVGHFLRVYGTRNTAHVDWVARTVTLDASPRLPSALGRLGPAFEQALEYAREAAGNVKMFSRSQFDYFSGLRLLVDHFYRSIRDDAPLPIPYRDMLRVSSMMDEVFRQLPQQRGAA